MTAYQPGIPTGTVDLDQDYVNLQNNFTQLNTTFSVDHIPITQVAQNGYHTSVHLNPVSTTTTNPPNNFPPIQPPTVAGYGQLWSDQENDGSGTDNALYFLTGNGSNIKLTTNFLPVANNAGTTFLPGGIILQWGKFTPPIVGNTVNFATPFPNSCFKIFFQMVNSNVSPMAISCYLNTKSKTGFVFNLSSSFSQDIFYIAIGN